MKKLLCLFGLALISELALAQDWLQTNNGATRSLKDILNFQEELKAKNLSLNKKEEEEEEATNTAVYLDDDVADDSVRLYLREIGKIPLLSAEEELALAQRVVAGDKKAKDQMAEANKAFAHYRW